MNRLWEQSANSYQADPVDPASRLLPDPVLQVLLIAPCEAVAQRPGHLSARQESCVEFVMSSCCTCRRALLGVVAHWHMEAAGEKNKSSGTILMET